MSLFREARASSEKAKSILLKGHKKYFDVRRGYKDHGHPDLKVLVVPLEAARANWLKCRKAE